MTKANTMALVAVRMGEFFMERSGMGETRCASLLHSTSAASSNLHPTAGEHQASNSAFHFNLQY